MAPIYDTDLAEERFSKDEWSRYELWEKVEVRLRRRKHLWIGAACFLFLCLSSVPIVMERLPKWRSLAATRRLAEEINWIKRQAIQSHGAFRIKFGGAGALNYVIEQGSSCSDPSPKPVRSDSLVPQSDLGRFALLTSAQGHQLGFQGFSEAICYDYLAGSDVVLRGDTLVGFGVMPVNDMTEGRDDRLALLVVSGPSAEISFE